MIDMRYILLADWRHGVVMLLAAMFAIGFLALGDLD